MVQLGIPLRPIIPTGRTVAQRPQRDDLQPIRRLQHLRATPGVHRRRERCVARRVLPRPQRKHQVWGGPDAYHWRRPSLGQRGDSGRCG